MKRTALRLAGIAAILLTVTILDFIIQKCAGAR